MSYATLALLPHTQLHTHAGAVHASSSEGVCLQPHAQLSFAVHLLLAVAANTFTLAPLVRRGRPHSLSRPHRPRAPPGVLSARKLRELGACASHLRASHLPCVCACLPACGPACLEACLIVGPKALGGTSQYQPWTNGPAICECRSPVARTRRTVPKKKMATPQ